MTKMKRTSGKRLLSWLLAVAMMTGLLPGILPTASAAYSDHVVSVDDTYPEGITVNLFDYWLTKRDDSDQSNPNNYQIWLSLLPRQAKSPDYRTIPRVK